MKILCLHGNGTNSHVSNVLYQFSFQTATLGTENVANVAFSQIMRLQTGRVVLGNHCSSC